MFEHKSGWAIEGRRGAMGSQWWNCAEGGWVDRVEDATLFARVRDASTLETRLAGSGPSATGRTTIVTEVGYDLPSSKSFDELTADLCTAASDYARTGSYGPLKIAATRYEMKRQVLIKDSLDALNHVPGEPRVITPDSGPTQLEGRVVVPTLGEQYKADCLRTEYTPDFVRLSSDSRHDYMLARLLHAVLGLMSEVGEIADALKKAIIYGKELDLVNLVEELGDESWYQSLFLDAIGSSWEVAWEKNIGKLRARYPDKFTQEQALVRNLDAERAVLEGKPPAVLDSLAFHDEGNGAPELYNGTVEDIVAALKEDFDQRMRRAEMESDGIDEYLVGENNDSYFGKIDVGWRAILREGIAKLLKELKGSEK